MDQYNPSKPHEEQVAIVVRSSLSVYLPSVASGTAVVGLLVGRIAQPSPDGKDIQLAIHHNAHGQVSFDFS